jgi:hypothetical protein
MALDGRRGGTRSGEPSTGPRVFVRRAVLVIDRPVRSRERVGASPVAPDAQRALDTLEAFGLDVLILEGRDALGKLATRDWLLTNDPEDCRAGHRRGARTILVGASADTPEGWPERCDLSANSVFAAVMEVVTRSASDVPASA